MSTFAHGVASGDPDTDRVVIWTRVSDAGEQPVELGWVVAQDAGLKSVVASGSAVAESDADHCVSVDVGGLEPGRHYWYVFESGGERSPVGRTKTLPAHTEHVRFVWQPQQRFMQAAR